MAQSSTQQSARRPSRLSGSRANFALPSPGSSASPTEASERNYKKNDYGDHDDDDDDDDDYLDDGQPLPFPAALARSDFLAPDFDPAEYLSSLANRHQTLEDLRSDLRERSAAISVELLELVNANYTSFLSLGSELKGGEERVEDVRVSLLGFRRQVEEIKTRVRERGGQVKDLNAELAGVRTDIEHGRLMLELDERIAELEGRLALGSDPARQMGSDDDDDDHDDDDDNDEDVEQDGEEDGPQAGGVNTAKTTTAKGSSPAKLGQLARAYVTVDEIADEIGRETPFVRKIEERLMRCRNTILLDLGTALKEVKRKAKAADKKQGSSSGGSSNGKLLLRLMNIYSSMDAQAEAVKALKSA